MLPSDVMTPAPIIDFSKLLNNIEIMGARAESFGINLRPHVKTHKSPRLATLQMSKGTNGIMTSTIGETIAFLESGFTDIIYAFPLIPKTIGPVVDISKRANLKVLVDNLLILDLLEKECKDRKQNIDVLIKIDCNYHRSGVRPDRQESFDIAERIRKRKHLTYAGVLTHAGHAYNAMSSEEVMNIAEEEQNAVLQYVNSLEDKYRIESGTVSIGSTPTVMNANGFRNGITEIAPGNYVFFDYTQVALGSCSISDCAMTVAATVVSSYDDRIIIDAGATALSKDAGPVHIEPDCGYGKVISNHNELELVIDTKIASLSQEHGKILVGPDSPLRGIKPGEQIEIIPNHSCLVSNLFDRFLVSSNGEITDQWEIRRDRYSSKL